MDPGHHRAMRSLVVALAFAAIFASLEGCSGGNKPGSSGTGTAGGGADLGSGADASNLPDGSTASDAAKDLGAAGSGGSGVDGGGANTGGADGSGVDGGGGADACVSQMCTNNTDGGAGENSGGNDDGAGGTGGTRDGGADAGDGGVIAACPAATASGTMCNRTTETTCNTACTAMQQHLCFCDSNNRWTCTLNYRRCQ
jgi:hypothetical protein